MKLGVGVSPTTSIVASQTAAVISAAGGGGASPTIESIRESRVFTWDASISTTSQTVANQEASPADGSSQTTYDVRRGTSTGSDSRDPNYDSGSQYYNQGSNTLDFLTMQGFKTTTTFTNSLHKADAEFTIEIGLFQPNNTGGFWVCTAEDTNDTGISVQQVDSGKIAFFCHRGTSGSFAFSQKSSSVLGGGGHHVVMSIHDGESSFFYIDDSTEVSFTTSYSSPSTGSCTTNWHWLTSLLDGNINNPRFQIPQNCGIGYFACYNKAVTEAEAAILYDNAPTRFQV